MRRVHLTFIELNGRKTALKSKYGYMCGIRQKCIAIFSRDCIRNCGKDHGGMLSAVIRNNVRTDHESA